MSNEDMAGAEAAASYGLGDLAGSVEIGAVPYDRLVAGGRRRLRRRRLLTGAAAAATVVAVAGAGAAFGGYGRATDGSLAAVAGPSTAVPSTAAVSATPGTPSETPSASATAAAPAASGAPAGAARDPFTPMRVKVGEGTVNGHTWQAWVAEWPGPTTLQGALRQDELVRAERLTGNPNPPSLIPQDDAGNWVPHYDLANLYYTVDGKRQADDSVHVIDEPGGPQGGGVAGAGASLGLKDGKKSGLPPVVIEGVRPEVAKVVITWKAGGSTEVVPVAVGDSTLRWYGIMAKPGSDAKTFTAYAADGSVVRTTDQWLRTD
ncbi:hypothetical protein [Kitasatospora sp. NPDC056531]|uniref:hypothetical protein n=1 Tax=Kitasatospora sp. NPDC056531 TaxID=3345856 RepID=UPI0036A24B66